MSGKERTIRDMLLFHYELDVSKKQMTRFIQLSARNRMPVSRWTNVLLQDECALHELYECIKSNPGIPLRKGAVL